MSSPPKVFVSATSGDLRSARQIVKEALLTIGCHPVEQTNFGPDYRTAAEMLRGKIGECQVLIHLAGLRYGAEPDPGTLPEGGARRSYSQMELHVARELGLRVYTYVLPEGYPYDPPVDADGAAMPPEDRLKAELQRAHREALLGGAYVYERPAEELELRTRILEIQEKVFTLAQERQEIKRTSRSGLHRVFVILLLVAAGIGWITRNRNQFIVLQDAKIANPRIDHDALRARLTEASERKLQEDLANVGMESKAIDREKLRSEAEEAHRLRLERVKDLVELLADLSNQETESRVLREMTRILSEPDKGVDAALAYVESQRAEEFMAIRAAQSSDKDRSRRMLQPFLRAAKLQAAKGEITAARRSFDEILELDPDWTEALDASIWFLHDQATKTVAHASLAAAVSDAEAALDQAIRFHRILPSSMESMRALSAASILAGDIYSLRMQPGDVDRAFSNYQRGLRVSEELLAASPNASETARDVSLNLNKLGEFLEQRGHLDDAETALTYFGRSLTISERLLAANPGSSTAASDVAVSLKLAGTLFKERGRSGDAEQALRFFERSLAISEGLLAASPDSAPAAREVAASLNLMGDVLAGRGQAGDVEQALKLFERSLAISERLLAANPKSNQAARDVSVVRALLDRHRHSSDEK